jgi:hypothetical protein
MPNPAVSRSQYNVLVTVQDQVALLKQDVYFGSDFFAAVTG